MHLKICNIYKILPLYLSTLDYHPYYYYEDIHAHFYNFNFLPCILLTSHGALCCSSDFKHGIYYNDPESVQLLWKIFSNYLQILKTE